MIHTHTIEKLYYLQQIIEYYKLQLFNLNIKNT